jgi:arylsulfatase A-like enzyme
MNDVSGWIRVLAAISFGSGIVAANAESQSGGHADVPWASRQIGDGTRKKIAISAQVSIPHWPSSVRLTETAPNVVLILLDDVGFGDASAFGGPVDTPALDKLAAEGLRYNNFHTAAICASTRAALLSGRNHHRMGFGTVGFHGFPGYNGIWKKSTASIADVLRRHGYRTAAFGKWDTTPIWERTAAGPFDRWPTGLGFEYFYGSIRGGELNYFAPKLWRNTQRVEPPATGGTYSLTGDLVNDAIRWITEQQSAVPHRPYFLYMAPFAAHWPHQVAREWVTKYQGRFDGGWNQLRHDTFARQKKIGVVPRDAKLTPWPKELPQWDSLSSDERRLYARQMEIYAGLLSQTDYELGRLLEFVGGGASGSNTLIIYIVGDNGAEGALGINGSDDVPSTVLRREKRDVADQLNIIDELGGSNHINIYSAGWAWAGNTPFQWMKHVASHFGGTRSPMILSWPARVKGLGGVRSQFSHVNDIAPTLYEAAGIRSPAAVDGVDQLPLDGVGVLYTIQDSTARSRHTTQYFEQQGSRAMYKDGWIASCRYGIPWIRIETGEFMSTGRRATEEELRKCKWELYNTDTDFSQAHDLADEYPALLRELQDGFEREAQENHVYPLDPGIGGPGPPPGYLFLEPGLR